MAVGLVALICAGVPRSVAGSGRATSHDAASLSAARVAYRARLAALERFRARPAPPAVRKELEARIRAVRRELARLRWLESRGRRGLL